MLPDFINNPDPEVYLSDNYVVLDFEIDTSHGDFGHPVHPDNQMLLACWSLGPGHPAFEQVDKVYSIWGNEYELQPLVEHLTGTAVLVAHNAKYELGWLDRCGFDIGSIPVFCTKIAEYVLSGNLPHQTSLDACCRRRGLRAKDPAVDNMMKRGVNPVEIPRSWLQGRCEQDVQTTEWLFLDQREHLHRTNRLGLQYTRCLFTPVLADMEKQGMKLDDLLVREAHAEETAKVEALQVELQEICGNINLNSSKQLAEFLYEDLAFEALVDKKGVEIVTATGKPLTDKDSLTRLKAKTPEQKQFMKLYQEYNRATQALSKYLDFYLAVCNQQEGVFYAGFNQTVTKTHRLSSSGMRIPLDGMLDSKGKPRFGGTQFQNQPNEYKRFFCAKRPGFLFTEEDGSGLEFRVAGLVGNDQAIKDDINNPEFDPHKHSAAIINDCDEAEVDYDMRRKAKAHTFKPLFGGTSGTKGEKRYYASFNERYHELVGTQEKWLAEAMTTKRLVLPWGMQFYYPYIRMDKSGYINERTKVFNAPIQSFATAEIIPIQAVYLWHIIRANGREGSMVMVNTVHDSVLTEVLAGVMSEYMDYVVESWRLVYDYVEKVYGMDLEGLPLGTEITYGTHWGSGEEHTYNVWKDRVEKVEKS
jgi:DNA polymerase I-like protein with 3'-5' exonuclease and polymerase domains